MVLKGTVRGLNVQLCSEFTAQLHVQCGIPEIRGHVFHNRMYFENTSFHPLFSCVNGLYYD